MAFFDDLMPKSEKKIISIDATETVVGEGDKAVRLTGDIIARLIFSPLSILHVPLISEDCSDSKDDKK